MVQKYFENEQIVSQENLAACVVTPKYFVCDKKIMKKPKRNSLVFSHHSECI
jgi:hypothetical protein